MAIDNFTPTLWSAKLLNNLNDAHVYANCLNRDYEGQIKQVGDTVKINSIGRITIRPYVKNTVIVTPDTLVGSQEMLAITQANYFNFEIDDIDEAQNNIKLMNDAMQEAAWGLADTADAWIAAGLAADVDIANILAPVTVGTGAGDDDAYETLVDLDVQLTVNNVPRPDRWVVVPPWYEGLLRKDPRFVSFGTDSNKGQLRGEPIGKGAGFNIWMSNNVPVAVLAFTIIAGYKGAATYAEQIDKVEAFRPQDSFSDACRGLHIFGGKVTRPYALASVVATAA
jgi:hypothetical protein